MPKGGRRLFASALALVLAATGITGLSMATVASIHRLEPTAAATTAPTSNTISIGQCARINGYSTPNVSLAGGGHLYVFNNDTCARDGGQPVEHTVTANATDASGNPLFDTFAPGGGQTTAVAGISQLAPGQYHFHCRFHPTVMKGTLTIVGGSGGVKPAAVKFEQPLFHPPVIRDSNITIKMRKTAVRVLPHGPLTNMWTYGGTFPGPTIIRPAGHDTKVTFVNRLPTVAGSVSIHYHGDHHKSAADGQPTTYLVKHGSKRTYDFPLTENGKPERAAFNWYHDHRMMKTSRNIWHGLAGMFITTDGKSKQLGLPGGRYDIPLMFVNRSFTKDNQVTNPFRTEGSPPNDGVVGSQILVNGRFAPYQYVSTHRYRLRLLNASNFTPYNFAFSNGMPFIQVGTGNGLLPHPVVRQSIVVGPAQRVDVVVDFHHQLNKRIVLQSVPRTDSRPKTAIQTPTANLMQFRVTRQASSDPTRIPSNLQARPKLRVPSIVAQTWNIGVNPGHYWTLNGKPFNPSRVDYKVRKGAVQMWKIHNGTTVTHFIHLHEELWRTVQRDGKRPPPWERGLEDTWRLDPGETIKVAAKFTDYLGVFMVHCHMLDHEDHGLMAQFKVVKPTASTRIARTTTVTAASLATPMQLASDGFMCRPQTPGATSTAGFRASLY